MEYISKQLNIAPTCVYARGASFDTSGSVASLGAYSREQNIFPMYVIND